MKLTDKIPSLVHRVLVFGPPKISGKTELVGKLSERFKLVYFDLENGYLTLTKLPRACQENIELISIPDTKIFPIAAETMLKVITGNRVEICEKHGKVACPLCKKDNLPIAVIELNALTPDTIFVTDSLTQLANSFMNHLTKNQEELYRPEWGDYRNQGQLMDKFLSQIQQSKFNVVCITHEAEVELEDGRKRLVPVAGTTNFSRNTAKYFDHVIYCDVSNKKHRAASSTTYSNSILTGSRTDVVLEGIDSPSLFTIFNSKNTEPPTPGQVAVTQLKQMTGAAKDS